MARLKFTRLAIWVLVLALVGTGAFADDDNKKRDKPEDNPIPNLALAPAVTVANDAEALMRLKRAIIVSGDGSWNTTVAVLPGYRGWETGNPCNGPWTGVTCSQGQVVAL
jgi:hypothetical protein